VSSLSELKLSGVLLRSRREIRMSGVLLRSGRVDGRYKFTVKSKVDRSLLYRLISC
jgi:hypothetical protein